jgi:phage-related minor tail protein
VAGKIKGITIEIGGETKSLQKAFEDVNKKARGLQGELRSVERLLKLDPKNTELLAQKQKLLGEAVENSKEKLERLRKIQEQVNQQFREDKIGEEQYRHFQRVVINAEQDLKRFEKQLKDTGLTAEQVGKKLQDAGQKMTDVGKDMSMKVTAPIVAAGAASFKMAADLQDAMGATDQIFKGAADSVKSWADNLESYYGIAEGEALEYANMMGTMLVNIGGLTEEQAAKQAQTLIELAGDLTAMYGGTTADAVRALTGALKGNNAMLDNYGMAVNDAMIKTKALEMGLYDGTGQMDLATKQAATLALIMEQTGAAQGQAAREAEGASGGMRAFATEIKNLATDIGEVLLPVITPFIQKLKDIVGAFGELSPGTQKAIIAIAGIAAAIGPVLVVLGTLASAVSSIIGILPVLGAAFAALTGPIGIAIAIIGGLVAAGVLLYKNWDTIKAKAGEIWVAIKNAFSSAVNAVKSAVSGMIEAGKNLVQGIWTGITSLAGWLYDKVASFVKNNIVGTVKKFLGIASPSKVMIEFGRYVAEGLARGMEEGTSEVAKRAQQMAQAISNAVQKMTGELSNALNLSNARLELQKELLGDNAEEYEKLALELEKLNNEKENLIGRIDVLTAAYETAKKELGENNEATKQYAYELEMAQIELQKMEASIKKTNSAIDEQKQKAIEAAKAQAKELRSLADEVAKVEKKYREDLAEAAREYQNKVEEVNRKLIEDERKVTEEYRNAVKERAKTLRDFVGLFDAVSDERISGRELLLNLQGQVKAFEDWQKNIAELAARGIDEGLIEELREMGPKAGPQIAALNTLTDEQLTQYVTLWKEKNQLARAEAVNQLQEQKVEMQNKLQEIRLAAAEQLEAYRVEWQKKNAEIRKNAEEEMKKIEDKFKDIAEAGTKYGISLVANFISGMESRFDQLRRTLERMAEMVDSYMPHSPAKRGPLSRIMEWGPALVGSLSEGIKKSMPQLESAMRSLASVPASALAGGNTVSNYYNTSDNRVINITVQDGEDLLRTLHRLGVRIP